MCMKSGRRRTVNKRRMPLTDVQQIPDEIPKGHGLPEKRPGSNAGFLSSSLSGHLADGRLTGSAGFGEQASRSFDLAPVGEGGVQ